MPFWACFLHWVRVQHFENINMISLKGLFLPGPTCSFLLCQGFCDKHLVRTTLHSLMISPGLAFEENIFFPLGISRSLEGGRNLGVKRPRFQIQSVIDKVYCLRCHLLSFLIQGTFLSSMLERRIKQEKALLKCTPVQTTDLYFPVN